MTHEEMIRKILELGASKAAVIPVSKIRFDRSFRKLCEMNTCGNYGRNWMCPPYAGEIDDLIARAKGYEHAIVYQLIGQLEDSYDFEGMMENGKRMNRLVRDARAALDGSFPHALYLGAGGCSQCEKCAKLTDEPCRFPELAMMSLETCGVAVSELAKTAGMKYINGQNTVTNFAAILFDE